MALVDFTKKSLRIEGVYCRKDDGKFMVLLSVGSMLSVALGGKMLKEPILLLQIEVLPILP